MKKYLTYFKMNFIYSLQYRAAAYAGICTQFFFGFLYIMVYFAFYSSNPSTSLPMNFKSLVSYLWLEQSFLMLVFQTISDRELINIIKNGNLAYEIVRPQGIIFQCICEKMQFVKVSRNLQSIIIIIALIKIKIKLNLVNIYLIIMMLFASIIIFLGIFLFTASYCFITVQGLEVKNVLTDGGKELSQYPIGIFRKVIVFIFSFIIPFASVNYYPLLYLTGRSTNILCLISPWMPLVYLISCFLLFKLGLKHYSSTGS